MYPSALLLISTLSIWSLGVAAAPVPHSSSGNYARQLLARSSDMLAVDDGILARMVDDILEKREGEPELPSAETVPAVPSAYEQKTPKPKHYHHHYTVESLNAYLSSHYGHHLHHHQATSQRKAGGPTNGPTTESAKLANAELPLASAQPPVEAALGTNAPPASEGLPAPEGVAPPADAPPVMRRAFLWDDSENLD